MSESALTLAEFMERFGPTLMERARRAFPPVVERASLVPRGRKPMGIQALASTAMVESLKRHRAGFLVAEMSTGKTKMALDALMGYNPRGRYLVLCPPHLVAKWRREAETEGFHAVILSSLEDIRRLPALPTPLVAVLSRERAKLGPGWRPAYVVKSLKHRDTLIRYAACPSCGRPVQDKDGIPLSPSGARETLARKKRACPVCGEPLWQVAPPRRVALADALKRFLPKGFFDALVLDEAHEYKGQGSAQGIVAGVLADWVGRVLVLTGTLFGGYASTLFALFRRFLPGFREEYGPNDLDTFVARYGVLERVVAYPEEDGRRSRRRSSPQTKEKPGLSPLLLPYLLPYTAFVRLPEVAEGLPPYREEVIYLDLEEPHRSLVKAFYNQLKAAVNEALARGSKRLLGGYLQGALNGPDAHFTDVEVRDPESGWVVAQMKAVGEDYLSPKEKWLIRLLSEEKSEGRRVLIYVQNTGSKDQVARLTRVLTEAGFRAVGLYADTVKPEEREAWLRRKVAEGVDVLVAHPRLVQTGLDLVDFPTLVFHQVEYSVYTLRQAARRSLRIGQTRPVKVFFLAYRETLQEAAISLVATKARSSLALEGELVEGGLAVASEEDPTLVLAQVLAGKKSLAPASFWENLAGVDTAENPARETLVQAAQQALAEFAQIHLPTLKESRRVRVGKTWTVLPAGQPVLFEEVV